MKRSISLLSGLVMLVLSFPAAAQCGCAAGPCEEASLQSVAAENPEETGFGLGLSPVSVPESRGMEISISSHRGNDFGAFAALMVLCAFFIPAISVVRERMSSTGPLLSLDLARTRSESAVPVEKEIVETAGDSKRTREVPARRRTSRLMPQSFLPATWS